MDCTPVGFVRGSGGPYEGLTVARLDDGSLQLGDGTVLPAAESWELWAHVEPFPREAPPCGPAPRLDRTREEAVARWAVRGISLVATLLVLLVAAGLVTLAAAAFLHAKETAEGAAAFYGQGNGLVSTMGEARVRVCEANRRLLDGAARAERGNDPDGRWPATPGELVPEWLPEVPRCPAGGTYSLTPEGAVCSKHGGPGYRYLGQDSPEP